MDMVLPVANPPCPWARPCPVFNTPGHQRGKALIVPSIQRQGFHLDLRYRVGDFASAGLNLIRRGFDGYVLRSLADRKRAVDRPDNRWTEKEVGLGESGKTCFADGHLIGSAGQSRQGIGAF